MFDATYVLPGRYIPALAKKSYAGLILRTPIQLQIQIGDDVRITRSGGGIHIRKVRKVLQRTDSHTLVKFEPLWPTPNTPHGHAAH